MTAIKDRLEVIFRKVFDKNDLKIYDAMAAGDLEEWDSLMHIRLIVAIEKEFSVKFTVSELTRLKDVGDTMRLIEKKMTGK